MDIIDQTSRFRNPSYFRDGKKLIDYVLVLDKRVNRSATAMTRISNFMIALQKLTLRVEIEHGLDNSNLYIMIHVPKKALIQFADAYGIDIFKPGHNYNPTFDFNYNTFETTLHHRGFNTFIRQPGEITNKERILIVNELLGSAQFDETDNMVGLKKLNELGYLKAHFPLHDGDFDCTFDDLEMMSDRQKLYKFWSNFNMWYRQQPLNLIEKYYGSDVAFYFAWCGMYNSMLVVAAAVGIICFLMSMIVLHTTEVIPVKEICNSNLPMCPVCYNDLKCTTHPLKSACTFAQSSYLFDNNILLFFSMFMSIWSISFLNLWYRYENVLKIRWNVDFDDTDTKIRPEYKENAKTFRLSQFTKELVPHIPLTWKYFYVTITYGTCILMILVVILAITSIILFKVFLGGLLRATSVPLFKAQYLYITMALGCLLQVIFIKMFGIVYGKLSVWLTNMEHPRTQSDFDNSVVYKRYFLGFTNNYLPLFYIAFIKGRLYRPHIKCLFLGFSLDICPPTGCVSALCTQLAFLMLFKSLVGNILTLIRPPIMRALGRKHQTGSLEPRWEKDYKLAVSGRYLMTTEFMEMIIQFGFVTCFVVSFPLAPLCALLNNIFELRLDALKLVTRHRRPIPRMTSGIGPWNDILKGICYFSIITNVYMLDSHVEFTQLPKQISNPRSEQINIIICRNAISAIDHQNVIRLGIEHSTAAQVAAMGNSRQLVIGIYTIRGLFSLYMSRGHIYLM